MMLNYLANCVIFPIASTARRALAVLVRGSLARSCLHRFEGRRLLFGLRERLSEGCGDFG